MNPCVLVINPGSTSTKVALFSADSRLFEKSLSHSSDELSSFKTVASQYEFRRDAIIRELRAANFDTARLTAVVGRGGLLRPIPGGVYRVSEAMKNDILAAAYGEHASNLGALIADDIAKPLGIPAYIADPVVVDELTDLARVSGNKLFKRISIFHALNQKAVARRYATEKGRRYEDLSLIIAHLGGGVSVGLHQGGRVVDVNNALNGEGPFSPERSGTLPAGALVKLCFSGKYGEKEINRLIAGAGGMVSFLGTNDMREVEKRRNEGDTEAILYFDAFIYQVSKAIGALAAAASGAVDALIVTGGIAHGKSIVEGISRRCAFIAPVTVYPGEGELEALAQAGFGVLSGSLQPMEYLP
ncbi:MAG: butyrate kinase [Spirochaetia bacterium]|jgi:butyrate kinase|nr:butyrate kinase [Spirochaetia bacterium]